MNIIGISGFVFLVTNFLAWRFCLIAGHLLAPLFPWLTSCKFSSSFADLLQGNPMQRIFYLSLKWWKGETQHNHIFLCLINSDTHKGKNPMQPLSITTSSFGSTDTLHLLLNAAPISTKILVKYKVLSSFRPFVICMTLFQRKGDYCWSGPTPAHLTQDSTFGTQIHAYKITVELPFSRGNNYMYWECFGCSLNTNKVRI